MAELGVWKRYILLGTDLWFPHFSFVVGKSIFSSQRRNGGPHDVKLFIALQCSK